MGMYYLLVCPSCEGDSQGDLIIFGKEKEEFEFLQTILCSSTKILIVHLNELFMKILCIPENLENIEQTFQISHNLLCVIVLMNLSPENFHMLTC